MLIRNAATALALTASLGLAACATHGPGGVAYDTYTAPAMGATVEGAGGSVSGGSPPSGQKEQRGNTPPGLDRDGHGPAAGAIIDPTGVVTGTKPQ